MPIYVRAGALIPVDPIRQYTSEPVTAPTTLRVDSGADGAFTLYEDDGISQEYLRNVATVTFTWVDRSGRLTIAPEPRTGVPNPPPPRTFEIVVLPEGTRRTITCEGRPITLDVR